MASIAVDVMSGDSGAPECIPGALHALWTLEGLDRLDTARVLQALADRGFVLRAGGAT